MKSEEFNQFKEYQNLKLPDEGAIFELINISQDTLNPGRLVVPTQAIAPTDVIYFNDETQKIASFVGVNIDKTILFDNEIIFNSGNLGRIFLTKGKPEDERRFKFLTFCNANASNKHRVTTFEPLFKRVDEEQDANDLLVIEQKKSEAIAAVFEMNDKKVEQFAVLLGYEGTIKQAKAKILTYAKENPVKFIEMNSTTKGNIANSVLLKEAIAKGLLVVDKVGTKKVYFGEERQVVFDFLMEGKFDKETMLEYITKNNPEFFETLTVRLEK